MSSTAGGNQIAVTPKQKRVFDLVLEGLSNAQIAERLGNTRGSISQVLVKLYRRLGLYEGELRRTRVAVEQRKALSKFKDQIFVKDGREENKWKRL